MPVPAEFVPVVPVWPPVCCWDPVVVPLFGEATVEPSLRSIPDCTPAWLRAGSWEVPVAVPELWVCPEPCAPFWASPAALEVERCELVDVLLLPEPEVPPDVVLRWPLEVELPPVELVPAPPPVPAPEPEAPVVPCCATATRETSAEDTAIARRDLIFISRDRPLLGARASAVALTKASGKNEKAPEGNPPAPRGSVSGLEAEIPGGVAVTDVSHGLAEQVKIPRKLAFFHVRADHVAKDAAEVFVAGVGEE